MASPVQLQYKNWALQRCVAALRAASPAVIGMIPYTALLASVLTFLILLAQRIIQGGNPRSLRIAIWAGLLYFISSLGIAIRSRTRKWHIHPGSASSWPHRVFAWTEKSIPAYFVLAVNAWLLLLLLPVYFSVWLSSYNRQIYFGGYGIMDKRGLVCAYLVTIGAFFVLPAFFKRLSEACRNEPSTWGDFIKAFIASKDAPSGGQAQAEPRHWIISLAVHFNKVLLGVALAAIFFAPPWHVHFNAAPVELHEVAHLGGLQAIHRGFLPYIGAASDHYGPGSQLLTYLYMKYGNRFTIVGFRESCEVIHWLAATVFMVAVFLRFRLLLATVIAFIALALPPLTFFQFAGGLMYGFFGWANALRYLGAFLLLLFLPTALTSETSPRMVVAKGAGLGLIFAFFCYMAQENLTAGVISGLIFLAVGWLTQSYTTERLVRVLLGLALGFAAFWVPLLGFYAYHGQLLSFLDMYFLANKLFAHGYANSAYLGGLQDSWGKTYYFMPGLMVALGGLALYRPGLSSLEARWDRERFIIIAMAIFCLVAHTGGMFRADSYHLTNTMIGLAVLVLSSVVYLPELIGPARGATRWSLRIAIVVVFVVLLPGVVWQQAARSFRAVAEARNIYWLGRADAADPPIVGTTETFRRVGADLLNAPQCCSDTGVSAPMRNMTELMVELKNIAGDRVTYVNTSGYGLLPGSGSGLQPGIVYFFADLVPAPIYAERADMIVNSALLDKFLRYFKNHAGSIQCIIADHEDSPEIEIFKSAHPVYRVVQREFVGRPMYVFLADTPAQETKSHESKPNWKK